jgi:hypothetical protein
MQRPAPSELKAGLQVVQPVAEELVQVRQVSKQGRQLVSDKKKPGWQDLHIAGLVLSHALHGAGHNTQPPRPASKYS